MYFDNSSLPLPVHPGDDLYYADEGGGYVIYHVPHAVEAVVLTADNKLQVITDIDEDNRMDIGSDYFLTFEEAKAWADEHRRKKPFRWGHDAPKWMDAETWIPLKSSRIYVKIRKGDTFYVCSAFYHEDADTPGFYESEEGGQLLTGVVSWIDTFDGLDKVLEAADYQMPDTDKCYPYYE
ncbi:MAG: hypothetical protein J6D53_00325 [Blautia sp.]|nr:hypothetical protein [Blautia sp.]